MTAPQPSRPTPLRRRHPTGAVAAAVILLVSAFLAGCSSDSGSEGAASPTSATSGSTTTPAETDPPSTTSPASDPPATTSSTDPDADTDATMTLTSTAFADGEAIPATFACADAGGQGASPPLSWTGVPADAKTLVLVVHDPDAPIPGGFTHLVTAFDPSVTSFAEGAAADGGPMAAWIPMCPPSGEHRYRFTLYAFGPDVTVPGKADKAAIDGLADQALASATLTGRFAKP